MKLYLAATAIGSLIFGQATAPNSPAQDIYFHAKDLTVSGLLLGAVIFLYRELNAERKKGTDLQISTQNFVAAQTEALQKTTEAHRIALDQVCNNLIGLETAAREQSEIYKRHIDPLVKAATGG